MKKIILSLIILFTLCSTTFSEENVNYTYPILVQPTYLFPLGYRYVTPVPPQQPVVPASPVQPLPKPQFKTPIRDSIYYGMYNQRVWRYNRLGNLLNVQPTPNESNDP
jgi:hypothetical protein